jgi:hypothetical protein
MEIRKVTFTSRRDKKVEATKILSTCVYSVSIHCTNLCNCTIVLFVSSESVFFIDLLQSDISQHPIVYIVCYVVRCQWSDSVRLLRRLRSRQIGSHSTIRSGQVRGMICWLLCAMLFITGRFLQTVKLILYRTYDCSLV